MVLTLGTKRKSKASNESIHVLRVEETYGSSGREQIGVVAALLEIHHNVE